MIEQWCAWCKELFVGHPFTICDDCDRKWQNHIDEKYRHAEYHDHSEEENEE